MSANSKKSMAWASVLILLGLVGLLAGDKSLPILIPAAILVWIEARPALRGSRN